MGAREIFGALLLWVSGGRIVTWTAREELCRRSRKKAAKLQELLNEQHWRVNGWNVDAGHNVNYRWREI